MCCTLTDFKIENIEMYKTGPFCTFCLEVQLCFVPTRYESKPGDDYEDPRDVQAIKEAQENMGCYKLKTARDYRVPEDKCMNTEKRTMQLASLEVLVRELFHKCGYFSLFTGGRIV